MAHGGGPNGWALARVALGFRVASRRRHMRGGGEQPERTRRKQLKLVAAAGLCREVGAQGIGEEHEAVRQAA